MERKLRASDTDHREDPPGGSHTGQAQGPCSCHERIAPYGHPAGKTGPGNLCLFVRREPTWSRCQRECSEAPRSSKSAP